MYFSYFDTEFSSDRVLKKHIKSLDQYRNKIQQVVSSHDNSKPEYSLVHAANPSIHDQLESLHHHFSDIKHLILVGIGGSNLGTEAVHELLGERKVQLHTIDAIAPYQVRDLLKALKRVKKVEHIALCIVSKSGATTETMVNASVLREAFEEQFGAKIHQQTICIGNPKTSFVRSAKKLGAHVVTMPEVVGGRYSVGTEVGLIPLTLLGHNVDAFIAGLLDASNDEYESVTAENAARLYVYLNKKYTHYNFFAFEPRLYKLGAWYRQLQAESLGKHPDKKSVKGGKGFMPIISTAVELHSTGQLHMSGLLPTYTDFVTFDDLECDFAIPKKGWGRTFAKHTMQEIVTGIYGGVIGAYQSKHLPYRTTIFTEDLPYSVGLFMGMRMRETMYIADLLGINAFDQPNVELYKDKTKDILGI